jgi:hypothetical protein
LLNLISFFRFTLFNDLIWICNLQNKNATTNKPNKMDCFMNIRTITHYFIKNMSIDIQDLSITYDMQLFCMLQIECSLNIWLILIII